MRRPNDGTERGTIVDYHLIRLRRKTLALKVIEDGSLEARAPLDMPVSEIDRFIRKKSAWIQTRQKAQLQKTQFRVTDHMWLRLLGVSIPVLAVPDGTFALRRAVNPRDNLVTVPTGCDEATLKRGIVGVYRTFAEEVIRQRVAWFEMVIGNHPVQVRINGASTRWGSCSSKGRLNFSWKLIMADGEAIDAVVIHELCHLSHMNHSQAFWKMVHRYCPDYPHQKKKLTQLSEKLASEDWKG